MNKTAQYKKFIARSTSLLRQAGEWVDVSLEGFEGSLDTSDEALVKTCILLLQKTSRVLLKLHEWLKENTDSGDFSKVTSLIKGFQSLTNSWASGNIKS